jgi:magnesium transporter
MKKELKNRVNQTKALIKSGDKKKLRQYLDSLDISLIEDIIDEIPDYAPLIIEIMSLNRAVNVFRILDVPTQERIVRKLPKYKVSEIINLLPPDDQTAFLGELDDEDLATELMSMLSPENKKEVSGLLAYPEDSVGRLMTPDYLAVNKGLTVREVLDIIRKEGKNMETIDVIYVLDDDNKLLDDLRIRDLLLADPQTVISTLLDNRLIYLNAEDPEEDAIQVFKMNNRVALPVINSERVLLGIVTIDDVLWLANEEYSEDMQRFGGSGTLDEPYLDVPIYKLIWKRAGWLIILFVGELLTASVMQYYEDQLAKVIVLAMFLPLMISSGGNSGSQASTLIIQAMAVGDVRLADWWRVFRREVISGLSLGCILGVIGFTRITIWHLIFPHLYGEHWILVALTVAMSLIGIVLWGSLIGSMLPFILRKLGADPATSSAPFVATLVDVTGLMIYLSIAGVVFGAVFD